MRLISTRSVHLFSILLLTVGTVAGQGFSSAETVKLLPRSVATFRAQASRPVDSPPAESRPEAYDVLGVAEGTYLSMRGERLTVTVVATRSHAGAYSLLTGEASQMRREAPTQVTKLNGVGVAAVVAPNHLAFYKGPVFVSIKAAGNTRDGQNDLTAFAQAYAATLPEAENEIPVLVKHLPDWETAQDRARYSVTLEGLQAVTGEQSIFEALNFDAGAEAVTADYGASRLVIVEYATPQLAADADERIVARLDELRAQGQPVPTSYRRVGNYAVFVLNAPNQALADGLLDRVKYEQKIQWLGENPLAWARAEKQHTRQAVSLLLGIAKTIAVFVGMCLGVGGVFGGIFFLHRRAQRRAVVESYSDAGGMLRLNIDQIPPQTDPARLIGAGEEKSITS